MSIGTDHALETDDRATTRQGCHRRLQTPIRQRRYLLSTWQRWPGPSPR